MLPPTSAAAASADAAPTLAVPLDAPLFHNLRPDIRNDQSSIRPLSISEIRKRGCEDGTAMYGPAVPVIFETFNYVITRDGLSIGEEFVLANDDPLPDECAPTGAALSHGERVRAYHSSLARGKAVFAAGRITVANGKIIAIDNWSGHYQPRGEHLQALIEAIFIKAEYKEAKGTYTQFDDAVNPGIDLDNEGVLAALTELLEQLKSAALERLKSAMSKFFHGFRHSLKPPLASTSNKSTSTLPGQASAMASMPGYRKPAASASVKLAGMAATKHAERAKEAAEAPRAETEAVHIRVLNTLSRINPMADDLTESTYHQAEVEIKGHSFHLADIQNHIDEFKSLINHDTQVIIDIPENEQIRSVQLTPEQSRNILKSFSTPIDKSDCNKFAVDFMKGTHQIPPTEKYRYVWEGEVQGNELSPGSLVCLGNKDERFSPVHMAISLGGGFFISRIGVGQPIVIATREQLAAFYRTNTVMSVGEILGEAESARLTAEEAERAQQAVEQAKQAEEARVEAARTAAAEQARQAEAARVEAERIAAAEQTKQAEVMRTTAARRIAEQALERLETSLKTHFSEQQLAEFAPFIEDIEPIATTTPSGYFGKRFLVWKAVKDRLPEILSEQAALRAQLSALTHEAEVKQFSLSYAEWISRNALTDFSLGYVTPLSAASVREEEARIISNIHTSVALLRDSLRSDEQSFQSEIKTLATLDERQRFYERLDPAILQHSDFLRNAHQAWQTGKDALYQYKGIFEQRKQKIQQMENLQQAWRDALALRDQGHHFVDENSKPSKLSAELARIITELQAPAARWYDEPYRSALRQQGDSLSALNDIKTIYTHEETQRVAAEKARLAAVAAQARQAQLAADAKEAVKQAGLHVLQQWEDLFRKRQTQMNQECARDRGLTAFLDIHGDGMMLTEIIKLKQQIQQGGVSDIVGALNTLRTREFGLNYWLNKSPDLTCFREMKRDALLVRSIGPVSFSQETIVGGAAAAQSSGSAAAAQASSPSFFGNGGSSDTNRHQRYPDTIRLAIHIGEPRPGDTFVACRCNEHFIFEGKDHGPGYSRCCCPPDGSSSGGGGQSGGGGSWGQGGNERSGGLGPGSSRGR
ncbi:MAG: hypothetical protein HY939_04255 [Gammaproteobacteria bacterium]|nr:hypothetical protein [Gammaproteobacteria bacterium]